MTGPLDVLFAQVREGMVYRRGGESTCVPLYPNCTCPDCLALRALSSIERHVQDMDALVLDMGEYVEATGRYLASMNDPSPAVAQSEALLARLNDLAPRREGERGVRWERP